MNLLLHRFVQNGSTSQVTTTFAAQADLQMARSRTAMFDFTGRRNSKALLGRFVRFHFVHGTRFLNQIDERTNTKPNRTRK